MKNYLFLILVFSISNIYSQSVTDKASIYLKNNDLNRAKFLLQKHVSDNSSDLNSIELLGDIYSFEKNWDKSLEYYNILIESDPKNASYNLKYGGAMGMKALSVSRFQAVVLIPDIKKHLELAAQLDKSQIESRRALVELYIKLPGLLGGSDEKALMYANQLKDLSPVNAYLAKGFIVKENENLQDAMLYYKNAFIKYRSSANSSETNSLNYELGKVSAELNLESEYGLKLLDKYSKKYSYKDIYSMEWVYLRKAQIMANLKNKSKALSFIDKALTLRGDFKEALDEKERIEDL